MKLTHAEGGESFAPTPIAELRVRALSATRKAREQHAAGNPTTVGLQEMQKLGASVDMHYQTLSLRKSEGKLNKSADLQQYAIIAAIKASRDFGNNTLRFANGWTNAEAMLARQQEPYQALQASIDALRAIQKQDAAQGHFEATLKTLYDVVQITAPIIPNMQGRTAPHEDLVALLTDEETRLSKASARTVKQYRHKISFLQKEWGLPAQEFGKRPSQEFALPQVQEPWVAKMRRRQRAIDDAAKAKLPDFPDLSQTQQPIDKSTPTMSGEALVLGLREDFATNTHTIAVSNGMRRITLSPLSLGDSHVTHNGNGKSEHYGNGHNGNGENGHSGNGNGRRVIIEPNGRVEVTLNNNQ